MELVMEPVMEPVMDKQTLLCTSHAVGDAKRKTRTRLMPGKWRLLRSITNTGTNSSVMRHVSRDASVPMAKLASPRAVSHVQTG
jgi:hypothetical protein